MDRLKIIMQIVKYGFRISNNDAKILISEIQRLKEDLENNQKLLEFLSGGQDDDKMSDDWLDKEAKMPLSGLKNNNLWLIALWICDKIIIVGLFLLFEIVKE